MALDSLRKDLERSLRVRVKRVNHTTDAGSRVGTAYELELAEKDYQRAGERLSRARIAHAVTTREVAEYAEALRNLGGSPELPEGFAVYTNPDNEVGVDTEDGQDEDPTQGLEDDAWDGIPLEGSDGPQERIDSPEPTPRAAGRFARRGSQV